MIWPIIILGTMLGLGSAAFAQQTIPATQPDAGSLRQQIEGNRAIELPKRLLPDSSAGAQPLAQPLQGPVLPIQRFRFSGNTLLTQADFEPLLAQFAAQPMDLQRLRDVLTAQVAELYRSKGWVVYVSLQEPVTPQTEEAVFNIIEARLGQIAFEGPEPSRVSKDLVLEFFQYQLGGQERLNNRQVDRALLLARDLPGVSVGARQSAGQTPGSTDVVVSALDKPAYGGDVTLDNTGSRSTGAQRLAANLEWRSPSGRGDALATYLAHTEGSNYARLGYTMPVGRDGLRLGTHVSQLRYRVISPELKAAGVHGSSSSVGLDLNYPLVRARDRNLFLSANYDHKSFDNKAKAVTNSNYALDNFTVGLNGNLFDNWNGGGANTASLTLVRGRVDLDDSPNQADDRNSFNTQGLFTKLRYSFSRQQTLTDTLSLSAQYTGQIANKNLDGSEKMYLGGASGVRAYPSSEAGGSDGQMFNLALRARLPDGFEWTAFYDWGRVNQYHNTRFAGAPAKNTLGLSGLGTSLAWRSLQGLLLQATYARRKGDNPNPTSTGYDQDGSLTINRFWLSASYAF
jgi:hemolysin activation/secretion protein